jgi:hypothetical protein
MIGAAAAGAAMLVTLGVPQPSALLPDTLPQSARAMVATAPQAVTVGEHFRAYIRIAIPSGTRVTFPELASDDSLQLVARVRVDTTAVDTLTAVYPLVAWVAGEPLRASVALQLETPDGRGYTYDVPLRLPVVESVLPAQGEVEPRPPRGLMIPGTAARDGWWLWLLAALLALTVTAAAWLLLARPRRAEPADPRRDALRRLDLLEEPEVLSAPDAYYFEITRILRRYLTEVEPAWSEDLTPSELGLRIPGEAGRRCDRGTLEDVLRRAEPVKFGAIPPAPGEARRFWSDVRRWIASNPADEPVRKEAA